MKRDIELEATVVAKYCRGRAGVGRAQSPPVGGGRVAAKIDLRRRRGGFDRPPVWLGRRFARDASWADCPRRKAPTDRIRRPGGGRPRIQTGLNLGIQAALDSRWWIRSPAATRPLRCAGRARVGKLAAALTEQGWRVSSTTVGRLLHRLGYRLQSPRKRQEGATHPDRNAQFEHHQPDCIGRAS